MENLEKKYKKLNKIFIILIPIITFIALIITYFNLGDYFYSPTSKINPISWHLSHYLLPDWGVIIYKSYIIYIVIRFFGGKGYKQKKEDFLIRAFILSLGVIILSIVSIIQNAIK